MGNKTSQKCQNSSNKFLFQINSDNNHNFQIVSSHVPDQNLFKNTIQTPIKSTDRSNNSKIKRYDLQEIKSTYSFINKNFNLNFQFEVNSAIFQNSFITCNHQIICEYEEDKKKKMVHFSDENKITIMALKKIQNYETKILNTTFKIIKFFAEHENNEESSNSEKENFTLNLKPEKIRMKTEKVKIKNEKVQNILLNNFTSTTSINKGQKNKSKDISFLNLSKNSLTPRGNNANTLKQQKLLPSKKNECEKTNVLKNKIEEKITKKNLSKNEEIVSNPKKVTKKEDHTMKKLNPKLIQKEQKFFKEVKLNETMSSATSIKNNPTNKKISVNKNLKLDLSNNAMAFSRVKDGPLSSKSYNEAKEINFSKSKMNNSSRNSSVKSKENQPPKKSILKQKKPKFLVEKQNFSDDSSDEMSKTNRESFQTICAMDLNESRTSKSQKSQKSLKSQNSSFLEEEEEKRSIGVDKPNNPLKIHLKLDDLLNPDKNTREILKNKPQIQLPLKNMNINTINKEKIQYLNKAEYFTTTDTSKEDQNKFNQFRVLKNQKIESLSSSSLSDYHKIEEIVHSNVDFQKINHSKNQDQKVKHSANSSQFNHISEEASEFFKDELD